MGHWDQDWKSFGQMSLFDLMFMVFTVQVLRLTLPLTAYQILWFPREWPTSETPHQDTNKGVISVTPIFLELCTGIIYASLFWLVEKSYFGSYRVSQKNASKIFWMISPSTNILDGWDIYHLKDGICSSIWSTQIFL